MMFVCQMLLYEVTFCQLVVVVGSLEVKGCGFELLISLVAGYNEVMEAS